MLIDLKKLGYDEFQDLIHDIYRAEGFKIDFLSGVGPDGKRDLVISRVLSDTISEITKKYVVQCKRYEGTVNAGDVTDIGDTIERYQANGFILAITSQISQPLLNKLDDLNKTGKYKCKVLRPLDIYDMIVKYDDIFMKYFPKECKFYSEKISKDNKEEIVNYFKENPDFEINDFDLENIRKDLVLFEVENINDLKIRILSNIKLSEMIHSTYKTLLKRKPTLYEYIHFMLYLSNYHQNQWRGLLEFQIILSTEFMSKTRIIFNFNSLPLAKASLDEVYQHFYDFHVYHREYKRGVVEVSNSDIPAYKRSIIISSFNDEEFRVVCLNRASIPMKKVLAVDYNFKGFFQFFILVKANDGDLYYVQYINGKGNTIILDKKKPVYIQIYNEGENNGPDMLRKEMHFYDDLKNSYNKEAIEFLGLYIGVKGSIKLYNILID